MSDITLIAIIIASGAVLGIITSLVLHCAQERRNRIVWEHLTTLKEIMREHGVPCLLKDGHVRCEGFGLVSNIFYDYTARMYKANTYYFDLTERAFFLVSANPSTIAWGIKKLFYDK